MSRTIYPQLPVMLVDDEAQALTSFEVTLRSAGVNHIMTCGDSREVMTVLGRQEIEIMLLDLWMPHVSGEELLRQIAAEYPDVPVVIVTGADDVETAVKCMKQGALDYIVKPVEKSRLVSSVKRGIELRELHRENQLLKARVLSDRVSRPEAFADIVTLSPAMRAVFQYAEAVAPSPRPVLVTGETGVGKELVARALHVLSGRKGGFVPVNVAGLDDHVFADTLFGHKKGAFTGAMEGRPGLLEQAASGTLFLDEIGDLSAVSQVKLLRLLQDGEYLPLGSDVAKRSDARILVATNQDLEAARNAGRFRKDLYYRLCGHHIHIPPLRDRPEDLAVLLDHFLGKAAESLGRKKPTPPDELTKLLAVYHFPGNVRELESMVYNAVSLHGSGKLSMEAFKAEIFKRQPGLAGAVEPKPDETASQLVFPEQLPTLRQIEQLLVDEALRRSGGNQSIAAAMLGITRQALNKRLHKADGSDG
ncbi:MAG: sigma-54 dependent transcriptional regulator [Desulfobacterales bacterium]|jgi:DNA-binding NtrC family response regulator|nr:sigma-54 dependent transcriptional regulator [Desulfobacterales bacterium]